MLLIFLSTLCICFIQFLSDTRTFKFYFSIKHDYNLNQSVTGIEIMFIYYPDLNKSVFKAFSESDIILSYVYLIVYFLSSHFGKVPNLVHGIHVSWPVTKVWACWPYDILAYLHLVYNKVLLTEIWDILWCFEFCITKWHAFQQSDFPIQSCI